MDAEPAGAVADPEQQDLQENGEQKEKAWVHKGLSDRMSAAKCRQAILEARANIKDGSGASWSQPFGKDRREKCIICCQEWETRITELTGISSTLATEYKNLPLCMFQHTLINVGIWSSCIELGSGRVM